MSYSFAAVENNSYSFAVIYSFAAVENNSFAAVEMSYSFAAVENNSFAAVENNSMRFCINLTHIKYTLQPMAHLDKTQISSANIKWFNKTLPI